MIAPTDASGEATLVLADSLVDGSGRPAARAPAIVIRDGLIDSVESRQPSWEPPPHDRLIEAGGGTVLPGLIDAHVHLAFEPEGTKRSRGELVADAVANATSALAAGVTTVRDLGSLQRAAIVARDAVAAGLIPGPRILAAHLPVTTTRGHLHWFGGVAESERELRRAVQDVVAAGGDVVKIMVTGGNSTPGSDPYTPQYSKEQVTTVVQEAHGAGLRVAAHVLCTAGVRVALDAGVDTIEHGWTITGRRQDFDPTVAAEMAAAGVTGSVTAHEALRELVRSRTPADHDKLYGRLAPHRALRAAGVPLVVHSDAGAGPTRFDGFCESVAVFCRGLDVSPVEAIQAATATPAEALGLGHLVGRVEPGKIADLLLVDGDASRDIGALEQVREVLVAGRSYDRASVVPMVAPTKGAGNGTRGRGKVARGGTT